MIRIRTILAISIATLFSTTGFALPPVKRADTPLSWVTYACESSSDSEQGSGYCSGYIEGVFNTIDEWCVPEDVSHSELRASIFDYLVQVEQSEERKVFPYIPAAPTIVEAVSRLYPCD